MHRVLLDCDTGIDDSFALAYLLARDDVDLVGIASTAGNVPTDMVVANNLGWLALTGRTDIPVAAGSADPLVGQAVTAEETHGPRGVGYAELPAPVTEPADHSAAEMWVRCARASPGELTGLIVGPSTNLARALELEPELPHLLRRIYIMGGALNHRGNTEPTTEWNVACDPEALHRVGDRFAGLPPERLPVLVPLDATESIEMRPEHMQRLLAYAPDSPILHALHDALRFYVEFHQTEGYGLLAHLHDPYVAVYATTGAYGSTTDVTIDVELDGRLTRGQVVADWLGRWNRPPNMAVMTGTDPEGFFDHYLDTVGRWAHSLHPTTT